MFTAAPTMTFGRPPHIAQAYRNMAAETGIADASPHRLASLSRSAHANRRPIVPAAASGELPAPGRGRKMKRNPVANPSYPSRRSGW